MSAIEIRHVKKRYKSLQALKGVSFTVEEGEFFGLLGPNGAGKTTLISILAGLARADEGTIAVRGHDVVHDYRNARRSLGVVPQELVFDPFFSVRETLRIQSGYYGLHDNDAWIDEVMANLDLTEKADVNMRALSGGMKRRVLVAQALVHRPPVIVLDEPTAGVDVELRRGMWDFLRTLNASGTAIVLTTHYLEEAEQLCSPVAIITKGEIIEEGSVKGLIKKLSFKKLIIDAKDPVTPAQFALLRDLAIAKTDDTTLELTLKPEETVNDSVRLMTKIGIEIANVRNSGSQLEEVFVNLIDKK